MSTSIRLPSELRQFLGLGGPQTLLLRGPPGSGKTTLSLAMLEAFPGTRIFVSSRVSEGELHREFPWLGENGASTIRVIDTTPSANGAAGPTRAIPKMGDLLKSDASELRDVRAFLWLPPALQEAWSHIDESHPTMVIVDSWDALIESYLGEVELPDGAVPDRAQVERLLLSRFSNAPVHLVLVLEREEQSQLDYLTNAVVQSQIDLHEDRMERWLRLRKMRGLRIANALYPFTLEGGKFDCIEPLGAYRRIQHGNHEAEPDPMPDHFWPGSHAFAEAFGRLPLGQLTLIELDPDVPRYVPEILTGPMVAQAALSGGPTLIVPEGRPAPGELWEEVKSKVPRAKFLKLVRFLDVALPGAPPQTNLGELQRTLLPVKLPGPGESPPTENEVITFLKSAGTPGVPSLSITHVAGLEALAASLKMPVTPEMVAAFPASIKDSLSGPSTHGVVVGRTGSPLFEVLRPMAGTHIRIRSRQGRVLLHGILPWTPPYLLVEGRESAPYGLLRVV